MIVLPPRRRYTQPQGAVGIDWGNPVTRGLVLAWTAPTGTLLGSAPVNNGASTFVATPRGVARSYSGTSQDTNLGTLPTFSAVSMLVVYQINSETVAFAASSRAGFGTGDAGVDLIQSNGTARRPYFRICNNTTSIATSAPTADAGSDGQVIAALGTWSASEFLRLYVDGRFYIGSSTTFAGPTLPSEYPLYVARRGTNYYLANVLAVAVWDRDIAIQGAPDRAEALSVSANPWQLFRAPRRRIYSLPTEQFVEGYVTLPRSRRYTQPQGAVEIDWGNSLTRGLTAAINGSHLVDVVTAAPLASIAGTSDVGIGPTRLGVARAFTGGTSKIYGLNASPATRTRVNGGVTVLSIVDVYGGQPTNGGQIIKTNEADGGKGIILRLGDAGADRFIVWINGAYRYNSSGGVSTGINTLIGRYDGARLSLFRNGAEASFLSYTGTASDTSNRYDIGGYASTNAEKLNAGVLLLLMWNRALTDAEIRSAFDNPWQVFRAQRRRLYVQVAAQQLVEGYVTLPSRPRYSQPRGTPRINTAHALAQDMFLGWSATAPTEMLRVAAVPGVAATWSRAGTITTEATPHGLAQSGATEAANNNYTAGSASPSTTNLPGVTVVASFVAADTNTDHMPSVFAWTSASWGPDIGFRIECGRYASGRRSVRFMHTDGFYITPTATNAEPAADEWAPGDVITVVASWTNSFGSGHITVVRNGVVQQRSGGDYTFRTYWGSFGGTFAVLGHQINGPAYRTGLHKVATAYAIRRHIPVGRAVDLAQNPWQLFRAQRRLYVQAGAPVGGTPASFTFLPSGGVVFGGAVVPLRGSVFSGAGGLALAGAAGVARGGVRDTAGGLTISGSTTPVRGRQPAATGGISFSGGADKNSTRDVMPSGGLVLGGVAVSLRGRVIAPTGGVIISGRALVDHAQIDGGVDATRRWYRLGVGF